MKLSRVENVVLPFFPTPTSAVTKKQQTVEVWEQAFFILRLPLG